MTAHYFSDPSSSSYKASPVSFIFPDDGLVPNNALPFLLYKGAVIVDNGDPEQAMEETFKTNGWGQSWRNGIFDYLHYHATAHEVLGVARGRALVRFGGDRGEDFEIRKGDVAILPAGTGHQCLSASDDLAVVGAYPSGQQMQVTRPTPENYRLAVRIIPQVALPETDPVYGQQGPLVEIWKKRRR
ncbi:MAG TPA: cupin domain-containing protein [Afipia sp.]